MLCTTAPSYAPVILASSSPRRRELLGLLGPSFDVCPAHVDEAMIPGEDPAHMAQRLASSKARVVAGERPSCMVIGADTLVVLDGRVLGKPSGPDEAAAMLRALRGRAHVVLSGLALVTEGAVHTAVARTVVHMRDYGDEEIEAYVDTGDPLDKAGAYAIQHRELSPVASVEGCYANVMGLPLCHLHRLWAPFGGPSSETPVAACNHHNRRSCDVYADILEGFAGAGGPVDRSLG